MPCHNVDAAVEANVVAGVYVTRNVAFRVTGTATIFLCRAMALLAPLPCGFIEAMDTLCLLPPTAVRSLVRSRARTWQVAHLSQAIAALAVFRAEQAQAPVAELFQARAACCPHSPAG